MRALILAAAISLVPVAAWAQSAWTFVPGAPTYGPDGSLVRGITADKLNTSAQSKADYPGVITSPQFLYKAPSLVSGSPITTAPSGLPNFPAGLLIHGNPGGYENLAVNLSVTSYNSTGYAQVSGGYESLANRGGIGLYGGIDSVNLYNEMNAPAPIAVIASGVTFDATHAYLPACLSPTQIATTKVGTWLQTQDEANPHSGMVTAVSTDGCTLTVDAWTVQGGSGASTPSGPHSMNVGVITAVWNRNTVLGIPSGSQVAVAFGDEIDILNNKGNFNPTFGSTDYRGISIYSKGTYNIHYGVEVNSTGGGVYDGFEAGNVSNAAFRVLSTVTGHGYQYDPTGGTAIYSAQTSGNILSMASGNITIAASGAASFAGQVNAGTFQAALLTITGGGTITGGLNTSNVSATGTVNAASSTVTGSLTAGGVTTAGLSVSTTAALPVGSAPSGTCSVAGQFLGDSSKLYWCPSVGGVWKSVAIATN